MNRIDDYMKGDGDYKFGNKSEDEELKQKYLDRINHVENESLESTRRALRTLHETEQIGTATASELNLQGEKLRNIETKLDDINEDLTATQKNINQIKSVFGGIKNRFFSWSSSSEKPKPMSKSATFENKPAQQQPPAPQPPAQKADFVKITNSSREQEMGDNLDMMSDGLSRLNALAKGLSSELDRQNAGLDRLNDKTGKTNVRIEKQNKIMNEIK